MICSHCYKPMTDNARYCMYCGALAADSGGRPAHGAAAEGAVYKQADAAEAPSPPAYTAGPVLHPSVWQHAEAPHIGQTPRLWQNEEAAYAGFAPPIRPALSPSIPLSAGAPPPQPSAPAIPKDEPKGAAREEPVPVMSVARLSGILILLCVPMINFFLACVWAFSRNEKHRQRRNLARAALLVILLGWVLLMAAAWWLITWHLPLLASILELLR